MILITVIIPSFNRKNVLPRAIDSVLKQKGPSFELILIDDGSTDGTAEMLKKQYPSVRYFFQKNQGPASARNLGIRYAQGEWIAFLDSDDEWMPGKLEAQLAFFSKNPGYLICQTEELWVRNGKRVNPMKKHQKYGGLIFEKCLPLCIVSPSAVILHRKLFDAVGLFDETLPACEDYDLWLRIASHYPIGLVKKPYLIKYGGHPDQRSHEFPAMDRFRIRSLAKILKEGFLTAKQASSARKVLEEKATIFIQGALKRGKAKEAEEIKLLIGSQQEVVKPS